MILCPGNAEKPLLEFLMDSELRRVLWPGEGLVIHGILSVGGLT